MNGRRVCCGAVVKISYTLTGRMRSQQLVAVIVFAFSRSIQFDRAGCALRGIVVVSIIVWRLGQIYNPHDHALINWWVRTFGTATSPHQTTWCVWSIGNCRGRALGVFTPCIKFSSCGVVDGDDDWSSNKLVSTPVSVVAHHANVGEPCGRAGNVR